MSTEIHIEKTTNSRNFHQLILELTLTIVAAYVFTSCEHKGIPDSQGVSPTLTSKTYLILTNGFENTPVEVSLDGESIFTGNITTHPSNDHAATLLALTNPSVKHKVIVTDLMQNRELVIPIEAGLPLYYIVWRKTTGKPELYYTTSVSAPVLK